MTRSSLVLIDRLRAEQFRLLGSTRGLFQTCTIHQDGAGVAWAVRRCDDYAFALTWLGPGWVFDPYAQHCWAEAFAARRQVMCQADHDRHARELQRVVQSWRCGGHGERLLWLIHEQVLAARRSVLQLPDAWLAAAVWGSQRNQWPRHWRSELLTCLKSLTQVHVGECVGDAMPAWGAATVLLTHGADLRGKPDEDQCGPLCPSYLGAAHHHYRVNVGRGFLGVLAQFAVAERDGVREYDFDRPGRDRTAPTLRRGGKGGRLISAFLPAELADPQPGGSWNVRQRRLLQAVVRETTRRRRDRRPYDLARPEVNPGDRVPDLRGQSLIACPGLQPDVRYVGFNGNKKRHGLGYRLSTPGGWLAKAGYAPEAEAAFLDDLQVIAARLDLVVVGVTPAGGLINLDDMRHLSQSGPGRYQLRQVTLRCYTRDDYRERWATYFQWPPPDSTLPLPHGAQDPASALWQQLRQRRLSQRTLAAALGTHPSFLSKLRRGRKPWPPTLLARALTWLNTGGQAV